MTCIVTPFTDITDATGYLIFDVCITAFILATHKNEQTGSEKAAAVYYYFFLGREEGFFCCSCFKRRRVNERSRHLISNTIGKWKNVLKPSLRGMRDVTIILIMMLECKRCLQETSRHFKGEPRVFSIILSFAFHPRMQNVTHLGRQLGLSWRSISGYSLLLLLLVSC